MYIVRFNRVDKMQSEEYFYHSLEDAENHFSLFLDDDSGLYQNIEVVNEETGEIIKNLIF